MAEGSVGEKPVLDSTIRIGSAIPQKRPVAPDFLDAREIDIREDQCLLLARLSHQDAERVADERVAPELDPHPLAAEPFVPDAVHRGDPAAIRDRVAALDRLPGVELLRTVFLFFGR